MLSHSSPLVASNCCRLQNRAEIRPSSGRLSGSQSDGGSRFGGVSDTSLERRHTLDKGVRIRVRKGGKTVIPLSPLGCNARRLFPPSVPSVSVFPPTGCPRPPPLFPPSVLPLVSRHLLRTSSFPPTLLFLLPEPLSSPTHTFTIPPPTLPSNRHLLHASLLLRLLFLPRRYRHSALPPTGEGVSPSRNAPRSPSDHAVPEIGLFCGRWELAGTVSPFVSPSRPVLVLLLPGTVSLLRLLPSQGVSSSFSSA